MIPADVAAFFGNIEAFGSPARHAKWREVSLTAEVPGWTRFKAAQDWLESTGIADREEIYLVAAKFAETMRNQEVDVPDEVRHRFDVLLSYLASATDSQPDSE